MSQLRSTSFSAPLIWKWTGARKTAGTRVAESTSGGRPQNRPWPASYAPLLLRPYRGSRAVLTLQSEPQSRGQEMD